VRLGFEGFRRVQQGSRDVATDLAAKIAELGPFALVSDGSHLPVFAFRLKDDVTGYSVYDVSEHIRARGWIIPAYRMPEGIHDMAVLRICVRSGFTNDLARILVEDLGRVVERLEAHGSSVPADDSRSSFHH
jgi:glutamate decarboxylase